jgi:hypothetical protein
MCHENADEAAKRGLPGFQFFGFSLAHYYLFGNHVPGQTNIYENFTNAFLPVPPGPSAIGTPDQVRAHLRSFDATGVDQVIFIQQGGNNRHEDICASLELFTAKVMPEFKDHEDARLKRKAEELAPYIEKAMARRKQYPRVTDIPAVQAYGRNISAGGRGEYQRPAASPAAD